MDKENQTNNEMKNEFTLPKGCMITKREIVPFSPSQSNPGHSKNKSGKSRLGGVFNGIIAMGIIACIVLGIMQVIPKIKNGKSDGGNQIVSTDTDASIGSSMEHATEDSIEITLIEDMEYGFGSEASNTDADGNNVSSEDIGEENKYGNMVISGNNGIIIGGLVVNYGFDDTWEAVIEDGKYRAKKQAGSGYVSFTVEDSDIVADDKTGCLDFLENLQNPFDAGGVLRESKKNAEMIINGKTCYYNFYTGTDIEGNNYTIIWLMQNFGGDTYAYIAIEDSVGYSIENLIQSLSINLEQD